MNYRHLPGERDTACGARETPKAGKKRSVLCHLFKLSFPFLPFLISFVARCFPSVDHIGKLRR